MFAEKSNKDKSQNEVGFLRSPKLGSVTCVQTMQKKAREPVGSDSAAAHNIFSTPFSSNFLDVWCSQDLC